MLQVLRVLRSRAGVCALSVAVAAPAAASTVTLGPGDDLQAAIDAAQPGDVIELASGATYTGNFRLPVKPGPAAITIRTGAAPGALPGPGQRMTPDYASQLAKIQSPNGSAALATTPGAQYWRFELLEFPATAGGNGDIIQLGASASQTQASQMPHDLVFDRVYIHGDPVAGQKRGIALNSGYTEITNSYIADIKAVGMDSQAICGWNGSGPYLIENNYVEAAGENIMFGGADPSVPDLVPADISIRRNVLSKPISWRQQKWSVKNLLELKNARRVMVEGNVIENVWQAAQMGFAVVLTPRNQDGRAPWSGVSDVTVRYNIIRHANGAFNLSGWDDERSSQQLQRVRISNNVVYDIDSAAWGGGNGMFLQIGNSPRDVTVDNNTVVHSGTAVSAYGKHNGAPWAVDGFVFRDNLMRHNTYGVKGDGQGIGLPTLNAYFAAFTFDRNVLAGGSASQYPAGNYFPTVDEFLAAFVNPAAGDFTLVPGSPFMTSSESGGPLGADVANVMATTRGTAPAPAPAPAGATSSGPLASAGGTSTGRAAVCRASTTCAQPPFSRSHR